MITHRIAQMDRSRFLLIMIGVMLIFIAMLMYFFVTPVFKQYKSLESNLSLLETFETSENTINNQIDEVLAEIKEYQYRLKGDMANLPEKEMEAYIIGVLQNISWENKIKLMGVKPSKGSSIHNFQEILFNVKLSGDYFDLYHWFQEIREDLGFIVIKQINLSPMRITDDDNTLMMDLIITSYKSQRV